MQAAVANGCNNAFEYNPYNAYGFIYDEGRSASTVLRLSGYIEASLPLITSMISSQILSNLTNSQYRQCITNNQVDLLTLPVSYNVFNLTPVARAPVGTALTTIGNILVAVLSSLFFVNGILTGHAHYVADMSLIKKTLYYAACFTLYGFGLACCLATIIVGLTNTKTYYLYSGAKWAQIMSLYWLNSLIWQFGHASIYIGLGQPFLPFFFGYLLVSSVIGGWSVDLADPGYKNFYQIFPFYWVNNIVKHILYDSLPHLVGQSVGILIGELIFFISLFFFISLKSLIFNNKQTYKNIENKSKDIEIIKPKVIIDGEIEEDDNIIPVGQDYEIPEEIVEDIMGIDETSNKQIQLTNEQNV